jgi:hypothetical protein
MAGRFHRIHEALSSRFKSFSEMDEIAASEKIMGRVGSPTRK